MGFILLVFLVFILLIIVTSCIKIVPQEHAYILERLGTYMDTWPAGLHFKVPFIDRRMFSLLMSDESIASLSAAKPRSAR